MKRVQLAASSTASGRFSTSWQMWETAVSSTLKSGSWINAVEGFFSALTRRRLKRGVFHSIVDLQAAIKRYIDEHNASSN